MICRARSNRVFNAASAAAQRFPRERGSWLRFQRQARMLRSCHESVFFSHERWSVESVLRLICKYGSEALKELSFLRRLFDIGKSDSESTNRRAAKVSSIFCKQCLKEPFDFELVDRRLCSAARLFNLIYAATFAAYVRFAASFVFRCAATS